ncbi:MAG TPA: hypothetical protein VEI50_04995 [Nitrospiraceae bacterium]|nr:hypothetical protein [Nitrospiraceae bacterium]
MRCQRCHRFMTVDAYVDMGHPESSLWLRTWRCGNCGKTDGPHIFLNRSAYRNWVYRVLKRWRGTRPRPDELTALTA